MAKGKINSIETLGLLDGPGIRVVIFMQGCPLRCIYCHNPETWQLKDYKYEYEEKELLHIILKYKEYFNNNGGVTFSGGEPLMQKDFLLNMLKLCKENNINTAIDTAGSILDCEDVLKYTDLIILDIKSTNNDLYKKITKSSINNQNEFIKLCNKLNKKVWIRAVIVPGINDNDTYIKELSKTIKTINNVERIELLPYHKNAIHKYEELNIKYKLNNTNNMDKTICKDLENKLKRMINN